MALRPVGGQHGVLTDLLTRPDGTGRGRLHTTGETATPRVLWSTRRARISETRKTCVVVLITQRSRVQIPPPLPGSAGQGPDRRRGVRALIFVAARWQQDLAGSAAHGHQALADIG